MRLDRRPTALLHRFACLVAAAALIVSACSSTTGAAPASSTPGDPSATTGGESPDAGTSGAPSPAAIPSGTPAPTAAPIVWRDCGNGFQCGNVPVPIDAVGNSTTTLNLTVSRLAATDPTHRIGSLIVNPGGPGAAATDFIRDFQESGAISDEIRARFDIVGFDPPGVGFSAPIRCSQSADPPTPRDSRATTSAELAELVAEAKDLANGCGKMNAAILPHMGVEDVARDLDAVRAALGDDKLTYVGFSYGSLIGSVYASRFPDRVRAIVLDGPVDPTLDLFALRSGQAAAFEGALDRFLAACSANASCSFHADGHAEAAFDALMTKIDRQPLPAPYLGREPVGPTLAWGAVMHSMYSEQYWPFLADALELARRGDASGLLLLSDPFRGRSADGTYSNLTDAYFGVTCLDWPAPNDVKSYTALAVKLRRTSPHFGALLAYNDLPCAYWPVAATRTPAAIHAPSAPPIVVVASTGDPATPYAWGVSLANQLKTSVFVTRVGEGHTSYLSDACVTKAIDAYLLKLQSPKDGLRCD